MVQFGSATVYPWTWRTASACGLRTERSLFWFWVPGRGRTRRVRNRLLFLNSGKPETGAVVVAGASSRCEGQRCGRRIVRVAMVAEKRWGRDGRRGIGDNRPCAEGRADRHWWSWAGGTSKREPGHGGADAAIEVHNNTEVHSAWHNLLLAVTSV